MPIRNLFLLLAALALLVTTGCASYAGTSYRALSHSEVVALSQPGPLDAARCDALGEGAQHLSNSDGESNAFKGPFGTGMALKGTSEAHIRQQVVCNEAVSRSLPESQQDRLKAAFGRFWTANDGTFGRGSE